VLHSKNDFAEISKNLGKYRSTNNFIDQNNYVRNSNNAAKNFDIPETSVLHNHFNSPTKLFSNLYVAKFLDISSKRCFFVY